VRNRYFGFSRSPFDNNLDQRFLFMGKCHEDVLNALLYFIKEKKSFALVCGDVGMGKTMIVNHLLGRLPRSVLPVLVPYPNVEYIELLRFIAHVLKESTYGKDVLELTADVKAALVKANRGGRQVVLILDEAHLLPIEGLENIRLLSNMETSERKLLQILLVGQNELGAKLWRNEMRQLRQRINIYRVLSPLSQSETLEYIAHRLKVAGAPFDQTGSCFDGCFDPECKKLFYNMTRGVPRAINQLCDNALLICQTEQRQFRVTKEILMRACRELSTGSTQAPGANYHARKLKLVLAAAATPILLSISGLLGFFKRWFSGTRVRKEAAATSENQLVTGHGVKPQGSMPAWSREEFASSGFSSPGAFTAVSPMPASSEVNPAKAQVVGEMDSGVTANDNVVSPDPDVESSPAAPGEAGDEEFKALAQRGNADAQFHLGALYAKGNGVPRNYAEAFKWYHAAAEQGLAEAQYHLGGMFDLGEGVPRDYTEALKWYRAAAEQGLAVAQSNLGAMYGLGLGVPRDYVAARMWFDLAAAQGSSEAQKGIDAIAEKMMPAQIAEAHRLAKEWKPKDRECGKNRTLSACYYGANCVDRVARARRKSPLKNLETLLRLQGLYRRKNRS
jgi:general secretion pathway protein A